MTICGLLRLDGEPAERAVLEAMYAASTVPRPAGRCLHVDGPFGLVAAAEPALGSAPPVAVDQGGTVVVLDGWLGAGARADGEGAACGAARLAAAYRDGGEAGFDGLAGDWVGVIWDPARGRLVCARAALAMRRLLTWHDGRRFVFGTELTQLVAAGVPARLNQAFLGELLCRALTTFHETLVGGVERLPAGQLAAAAVGRRPLRRRFDTLRSVVAAPTPVDRDQAAAGLRPRLERAVAAAVDDDVTGVLVSGGVDSSSVTALAQRLAAAGGSPGRLRPVAVTFPGEAHDESGWLDALDEHLGSRTLRLLPDAYDWERWRAWTALMGLPSPVIGSPPGNACGACPSRTEVRRRPRGGPWRPDAHKGVVPRGLVHQHGAAPPTGSGSTQGGAVLGVGIDWAEEFHLVALGRPAEGVVEVVLDGGRVVAARTRDARP